MIDLSWTGISPDLIAELVSLLLLLTPLWPLLVILLLRGSPFGWLWLSAPLPGLLLALLATGDASSDQLAVEGLLLGTLWWLDEIRQAFLLLTSLLWLLAGFYARGYLTGDRAGRRFEIFWLLSLSGNLLLIIAEDVASFYTGFTLMSLAAYGLVVHAKTEEALRAGRIYMVMAVLGEALLLVGLLGLTAQAPEPMISQLPQVMAGGRQDDLLMLSLLLGFGVKAGLPLLHIWLPLAHPVAPTPASAVLSGAMVKAGVLGWLLVLPLGLVEWKDTGFWLVQAGLFAALAAGVVGSLQHKAKAVLAYSSISQLGMMAALVGAGLADSSLWPYLLPGVLLFSVHHGISKGALFLAVGLCERLPPLTSRLTRWGFGLLLLIPPLALIGWLSSGTLSKTAVKDALYQQGAESLAFWLTLAAMSTAMLMLRYLWLLSSQRRGAASQEGAERPSSRWMLWSWFLLIFLGLTLPAWFSLSGVVFQWPDVAVIFGLLWPPLLALVVAWLALKLTERWSGWKAWAPPLGDFLSLYRVVWAFICRLFTGVGLICARCAAGLRNIKPNVEVIRALLRLAPHWEREVRREVTLIFTLLLLLLCTLLLIPL